MTLSLGSLHNRLGKDYPWTKAPLVTSAPMRLVAGPSLAHEVSLAGGLGFIGAGNDISNLDGLLKEAEELQKKQPVPDVPEGVLPVGIGFLNWGVDAESVISVFKNANLLPIAVWFFAPRKEDDLIAWSKAVREISNGKTKIWIQLGTVDSAVHGVVHCEADVLVVQGADAGGHGLAQSSSIISLLPEVNDALCHIGHYATLIATGGIMDGRGIAAAVMLGAEGVCMGTRFLVSEEAAITKGYKDAVIEAQDGGVTTVRSKVYDNLRGTTSWPDHYNGRGIINESYRDWQSGMDDQDNKKLYEEAVKRGDEGWGKAKGRLTTYAGTGVGLARKIQPAGEIVKEVREKALVLLKGR